MCAAAAAALPFLPLLAGGTPGAVIAATLLGMAWFLFCVFRLLLPIRDAAAAVQACAEGQPLPAMPSPQDDEVGRMMTNIQLIAGRLVQDEQGRARPPGTASTPDIRRAIERQELALHYRPLVDLTTARPVGAGAVLRWSRLDSSDPHAGEPDLPEALFAWMLDSACRQARDWAGRGLGDIAMTVDLSARQLGDAGTRALIEQALLDHGLSPGQLDLRCAAAVALADPEQAHGLFGSLRSAGIGVTIDRFGGRDSDLAAIAAMPFSRLGIDRRLIHDVDRNPAGRPVWNALTTLANGLSVTLLADGVERREEVETLRAFGCTLLQGPYFSEALPPDAFLRRADDPEWLAQLASPVHREIAGLRNRMS